MPIANSRSISKEVIALVLVILSAAVFDAEAEVEVRGARSCGTWIKEQAEKNSMAALAALASETWLLGYISGMAAKTNKDFIRGTDNPSISLWVSNYCQANPLKRIDHAGDALFIELVKQKRL